jgi:TRAP-type C4-dicarboxylate transport system permease large subunit
MKFGLFYLPTYLPAVRDAQTHYRGIIPFVVIYLIALAIITYVPDISLIGVKYLLAK